MADGITIEVAQSQLEVWLNASSKLAKGLAVSINGRSITHADGEEVRSMINYWSKVHASLQRAADDTSGNGPTRATHALARF